MAAKKKTAAVDEAAAETAAATIVNVVVVKQYKDKETKVLHKVGEKLAMSEERMNEILEKGAYIKKV